MGDKLYLCTCDTPPESRIATMHEETCAIWLFAMYNNEIMKQRHRTPEVQAVVDAAVIVNRFKDMTEDSDDDIWEQANQAMGALDRTVTAYLSKQALKEVTGDE